MKITIKQLKKLIKENIEDDAQQIYGDVLTVGSLIEMLKSFDEKATVLVDSRGELAVMNEYDLNRAEGYYDASTGKEIDSPCLVITTWS